MTRKQLLATLQDNAPTSTFGYHTGEEIADVLRAVFADYGDMTDEIKDVEDLYNDVWNECDSKTPVYNADLLNWLKANHTAVDDYRRETGGDASDSIIQLIMQAYCWTLQQDAQRALDAVQNNILTKLI